MIKEIAKVGIVALTSLLLSLLLTEVFLRLVGYESPSFYVYDAELGSALRPFAEGVWRKEGKAFIRINSDGLRDVEHSLAKPSGVFRIAVLGDSYMEGLQLPLKKLAWKVMEYLINRGCVLPEYRKVEVINFGVSGYGTGRELLMLRKKVWRYDPDMVILTFLTGNDIRDNSKKLNRVEYIPYFYINDYDKLQLDDSYLRSNIWKIYNNGVIVPLVGVLINHSRILQLLNDARRAWKEYHRKQVAVREARVLGQEAGLDSMVYLPPTTKVWKDAWAVTEALILQMAKEVKWRGARFLVVTLSNGIQVHPDPAVRKRFQEKLGIQNLFYPDDRVRDFCLRHGIEVLVLAPKLQRYAETHKVYLHGFENTVLGSGHWNENGHRIAGELMADRVCRMISGPVMVDQNR